MTKSNRLLDASRFNEPGRTNTWANFKQLDESLNGIKGFTFNENYALTAYPNLTYAICLWRDDERW